jgi:hypothetical protein
MQFTWDFNTATLLAIAGQIVLLIVFLVRTSNTAKSALLLAQDAIKIARDAHEKIGTLHGLLGLHREQVAREFVDKVALQDMEKRLSRSIENLSDRIDEVLNHRK